MTLAWVARSPARRASCNLCVLGVTVAGDTMHVELVPMSQCRHHSIVARVDASGAVRTRDIPGRDFFFCWKTHHSDEVWGISVRGCLFSQKNKRPS